MGRVDRKPTGWGFRGITRGYKTDPQRENPESNNSEILERTTSSTATALRCQEWEWNFGTGWDGFKISCSSPMRSRLSPRPSLLFPRSIAILKSRLVIHSHQSKFNRGTYIRAISVGTSRYSVKLDWLEIRIMETSLPDSHTKIRFCITSQLLLHPIIGGSMAIAHLIRMPAPPTRNCAV